MTIGMNLFKNDFKDLRNIKFYYHKWLHYNVLRNNNFIQQKKEKKKQ